MKEPNSERFIFSTSKGLMRRVDEWRRQQPDLPSRAEAVRRLLEKALEKA